MFTHNHMVTYKICTFVYLNVDYHHQEHVFGREWNDCQFQNIRGGVKVLKFWIVGPLKTLIVWETQTLKKIFQNPPDTFSDSLAILKENFAGWHRQIFFDRKIPRAGSLPVPITVSELWEWLFPFPSHNSWTAAWQYSKAANRLESRVLIENW